MTIAHPCLTCDGVGTVTKPHTLSVVVPAGVTHSQTLRLPEAGSPTKDGKTGHVYVHLLVGGRPDPRDNPGPQHGIRSRAQRPAPGGAADVVGHDRRDRRGRPRRLRPAPPLRVAALTGQSTRCGTGSLAIANIGGDDTGGLDERDVERRGQQHR